MNLKNEFNRITGMFDHGADRVNELAGDLRGEARVFAQRAQDGLMAGKDRLTEMEQMVVGAMRQRPQLLVIAGICLVALIVAKFLRDQPPRRGSWG